MTELEQMTVRPERRDEYDDVAGVIRAALVTATIDAATGLGYDAICLLGEPAYYARFGFGPATDLGVIAPDPSWGPYFQVLALTDASLTGRFDTAHRDLG